MNSYCRMNTVLKEVIGNASKITLNKYETIGDFIKTETFVDIIADLIGEYNGLEEEFEDYKQFVQDNFKQMTIEEQVM